MPRADDKRIPCEDCRFNLLGACMRNPPTPVWIGGELNSMYPPTKGMEGCFAGKPRVERSCKNCELINREDACPMNTVDAIFCDESYQKLWKKLAERGWHCSDWEVVE